MSRLTAAWIIVTALGAILMIGGVLGEWWVSNEYSQSNPSDQNGPCEEPETDTESCSRLGLVEPLWIPGLGLLILGGVIAVAGAVRGPR
ncbi:MAG: hypothetical protein KAW84_08180 [Thermoplasmata archaeon]|nr:hypothetical protein [Thermoplasmata archaeon]